MSASSDSVVKVLETEEWEDFVLEPLFGLEENKVIENNVVTYTVSDNENSEMSLKSDFTMDKLKGSENFYDWIFQMENYLAMKGYADCIVEKSTTDLTTPKETDTGKLSAAKGILVLSMESNLHPHIRKCKTALEIWKKNTGVV